MNRTCVKPSPIQHKFSRVILSPTKEVASATFWEPLPSSSTIPQKEGKASLSAISKQIYLPRCTTVCEEGPAVTRQPFSRIFFMVNKKSLRFLFARIAGTFREYSREPSPVFPGDSSPSYQSAHIMVTPSCISDSAGVKYQRTYPGNPKKCDEQRTAGMGMTHRMLP